MSSDTGEFKTPTQLQVISELYVNWLRRQYFLEEEEDCSFGCIFITVLELFGKQYMVQDLHGTF